MLLTLMICWVGRKSLLRAIIALLFERTSRSIALDLLTIFRVRRTVASIMRREIRIRAVAMVQVVSRIRGIVLSKR